MRSLADATRRSSNIIGLRPRGLLLRPLAACVVLCAGAAARGQPAPGPNAAGTAQTTLAGQVELARLVDLAAERLRLNVEYDAQALKSTVTLRLAGGVGDDELWALVNRALATRGFTTVRLPGQRAYSVGPQAHAGAP